jgi:hypothetical protein
MGLVRRFENKDLQTKKIHGEVVCTYTSFTADDGIKYFQMDTYGSQMRKLKGKNSQTIHMDEQVARELHDLLEKEFSFS